MRNDATLQSYPHTTLVVQCDECPRISRHNKKHLIQRFGPEAKLSDVLHTLCRPRQPGEQLHQPHLLSPEDTDP